MRLQRRLSPALSRIFRKHASLKVIWSAPPRNKTNCICIQLYRPVGLPSKRRPITFYAKNWSLADLSLWEILWITISKEIYQKTFNRCFAKVWNIKEIFYARLRTYLIIFRFSLHDLLSRIICWDSVGTWKRKMLPRIER